MILRKRNKDNQDELGFVEPEFFEFEKGKGGGKTTTAEPQKQIAPSAPVQEASVEVGAEDEDDISKKRKATSKGSLKIPLAESDTTGIRV